METVEPHSRKIPGMINEWILISRIHGFFKEQTNTGIPKKMVRYRFLTQDLHKIETADEEARLDIERL